MVGDTSHVFNRGVDKRNIFSDKNDYSRFVANLYLLNNQPGKIRTRNNKLNNLDFDHKQEKLVEILKWCLMPNHYHLLLSEVVEGGTTEFTKRIGNAYTKYFNIKNEGRSGYLFQNSAKVVPIESDSQFFYIPFYIDMNPLELKYGKWKGDKRKREKVDFKSFLVKYEWSSYREYFGTTDIRLSNQELFYESFDTNETRYEKEFLDFIRTATVSTWQVDTGGRELEYKD